ncbi:hypothetical protein, partial [Pseudomonas aeruginosa]|uniref:hypothetical protein n=1 Tax=Pseudomonas aeruginosa TaxID=287 RepID=UPI0022EAB2B0
NNNYQTTNACQIRLKIHKILKNPIDIPGLNFFGTEDFVGREAFMYCMTKGRYWRIVVIWMRFMWYWTTTKQNYGLLRELDPRVCQLKLREKEWSRIVHKALFLEEGDVLYQGPAADKICGPQGANATGGPQSLSAE